MVIVSVTIIAILIWYKELDLNQVQIRLKSELITRRDMIINNHIITRLCCKDVISVWNKKSDPDECGFVSQEIVTCWCTSPRYKMYHCGSSSLKPFNESVFLPGYQPHNYSLSTMRIPCIKFKDTVFKERLIGCWYDRENHLAYALNNREALI